MQPQYRQCRTCNKVHEIDFFYSYRNNINKRIYTSWKCRDCWTVYRREKHKTDEQRRRDRRNIRNSELKSQYGITIDDYEELAAYQNHVCAICKKPCSSGISLAVDHCHKTLKIRGLLCRKCNAAIGMFSDSPELLRRAADYLEEKL